MAKAFDKAENDASSAAVTITIAGGGGGTGPTEHTGNIVGGDSIWYPSGNPHIVKNEIAVWENGRLIIMPGCIVKFDVGAKIGVGWMTPGEIRAVGKADSLIVFTSNATTPVPGDWDGFDFFDATRPTPQFSYCEFNYGGQPTYGLMNFDWGGTIKLSNSTIRNAPGYGIWTGDHDGYPAEFTGNTITGCGRYPVYAFANNVAKLQGGNTLTGNAMDGIYVNGGNIIESGTWLNQGVPYVVNGTVGVGSDAGAYLTVADGTTVKFTNGTVMSFGYTVPAGLVANNVTFTSAATSPQQGDWTGFYFYWAVTDAQCRLTNCTIAFGGGDDYGNIWLEDARPTITGCTIRDSKGYGVYLSGSDYPDPDSLLANNTFSNNRLGDVYRP